MKTRQSISKAMLAVALVGSLLAAGCGSSARQSNSAPLSQTGQPAAAPATHTTGSSAPAPPSGGNPQDVPRQCLNASAHNPADFSVCLAKHGIRLSSDGKLTQCIEHASDPGALEQCMLGRGQ